MNMDTKWYALRVSYSREMKAKARLEEAGFEVFVPMVRKRVARKDGTAFAPVPAVSNLLFVRTRWKAIEEWIRLQREEGFVHFMWDSMTRMPLVVRDKAMEDFIKVCDSGEDILILDSLSPKLKAGAPVRVVNGPFSGVEGRVVRIRKSRRIVVELPGLLAVATTFIDPADLEAL